MQGGGINSYREKERGTDLYGEREGADTYREGGTHSYREKERDTDIYGEREVYTQGCT